ETARDRGRPPGSRPSPSYDCAPSRATDTLAWHEPDRSQKAHRAVVERDPGARPALLRPGPAGGVGRRVRPAVPRAGGPRRAVSPPPAARFPHLEGRGRDADGVQESAARGAHDVAQLPDGPGRGAG